MNENCKSTGLVEVSYLPIDCGFDLRFHPEMGIELPAGTYFRVKYMHVKQERVVEGDRAFVVNTLRDEGYLVAEAADMQPAPQPSFVGSDSPIEFSVADMGSTDPKVTRPLLVQLDRGGHVAAMHGDDQGVAYDDLADLADDYAMDIDELLRRAAAAIGKACALQWDPEYVCLQLNAGNQPITTDADLAFMWELLSVSTSHVAVAPGVDQAPLDSAIVESFNRGFIDQITRLAEAAAPAA